MRFTTGQSSNQPNAASAAREITPPVSQRTQRDRRPVTHENQPKRNPLSAHGPEAEQKKKNVPHPDLRKGTLKSPVCRRFADGSQKTPEKYQDQRPPRRVPGHP